MSLKHLTIGALVAVCTIVAQAAAQKNEVSGSVGRIFISDQGILNATTPDTKVHFGKGLTYELNYARRILDMDIFSVAVEVPFLSNPDEDVHSAAGLTPKHFSSIFLTPAARLNLFPHQAVSPWVSLGGGFSHFGPSSKLEYGGPSLSKGTTTGVLEAGVGLDVKVFGRFSVRGEARDFWSGEAPLNVNTGKSRQHNIFVGGGVVFHF
jgi:hypothetical protein